MAYADDGFALRVVDEGDLRRLAKHRNHPSTWEGLTSALPVFPHQQKRWLESLGPNNLYFIASKIPTVEDSSREDIGLVRINEIDWVNRNAQVGIDIFNEFRNQGMGKKLFAVVIKYGFQVLNMNHLWLMVVDTNSPARKIYSYHGFKTEGVLRDHIYRNGEWHDYIVMGMLKSEYES